MSAFENKVPPPRVALAFALSAWGLSLLLPSLRFVLPLHGLWSLAAAVAGLTVATLAMRSFRQAETTIDPLRPERASTLVEDGVYRWTRNPMYVGLTLVLLAWCLWLGNLLSLVMVVLFVAYIDRFQIRPEERALRASMGEAYDAYCKRVRRWL